MVDHANIMVVDDEPVVRDLLVDALTEQGHSVHACHNGQQALEAISANGYDLVLLDIGLPDMDGFHTMAEILEKSPDTPVIMITGDATIESAVGALKNGAYDYLRKPFQLELLYKTTSNALEFKRLYKARRESEAALRESEERFRELVENSLIGICIIQNNRIIYQNPEQRQYYGKLADKPLNKLVSYVHPDDLEKIIEAYHQLIAGNNGAVEAHFRFYPSGARDNEAEFRWVQCRASLFQYQGQEAILVNAMDITRSKELEHILRVKSKMISLGRVAAGIAHEIRNPLTGINSYLYTMEDLLSAGELGAEDLPIMKQIVEQMQVASNRIESVIKRVLDFSRPGAPTMSLMNANQPMEDAVKLSAVTLRKKEIEVKTSLEKQLPQCYGDAHLIEQVILNMIDNAVKAMEIKDNSRVLRLRTFAKNNGVYLVVSDTGGGVPAAIREKIFDPFFTTETDGSGIGLAICQRIINDHGGNIKVGGNRWGGATFTIELPIEKRVDSR
jgi:PAS domain S-box-containing protein